MFQNEGVNFADSKINLAENLKFGLERVDNRVGKERKSWFEHFLYIQHRFPKLSIPGLLLGLCGKELTLYHTNSMTTFHALEEKSLLKTFWEKKKMLVTSIFFFSHNVFYPMKDKFIILSNINFNLSSANAFNLGKPKILSGKGLN